MGVDGAHESLKCCLLSFRVVDVRLRHGSVDVLVQQLGYAYFDVDHDDDGGGGR